MSKNLKQILNYSLIALAMISAGGVASTVNANTNVHADDSVNYAAMDRIAAQQTAQDDKDRQAMWAENDKKNAYTANPTALNDIESSGHLSKDQVNNPAIRAYLNRHGYSNAQIRKAYRSYQKFVAEDDTPSSHKSKKDHHRIKRNHVKYNRKTHKRINRKYIRKSRKNVKRAHRLNNYRNKRSYKSKRSNKLISNKAFKASYYIVSDNISKGGLFNFNDMKPLVSNKLNNKNYRKGIIYGYVVGLNHSKRVYHEAYRLLHALEAYRTHNHTFKLGFQNADFADNGGFTNRKLMRNHNYKMGWITGDIAKDPSTSNKIASSAFYESTHSKERAQW